jgi:indole-3-glycerol phosphate synthase
MTTILDKIFADKKQEVSDTERRLPLPELKIKMADQSPPRDVSRALRGSPPSRIVAEIKRRTPFKGELRKDFNALEIARTYAENGAAALSVLTESTHFGGGIDILSQIHEEVEIPLLRKDFIFAEYQVYESRAFGADWFLLIATWLEQSHLADLMALGEEVGLPALVETHNEKDMEKAFAAGAKIIGINNRDLTNGVTDLGVSRRLIEMARQVPGNLLVCESGIRTHKDIQELEERGAHAFLIGESLMTSPNIPDKLKELLGDGTG